MTQPKELEEFLSECTRSDVFIDQIEFLNGRVDELLADLTAAQNALSAAQSQNVQDEFELEMEREQDDFALEFELEMQRELERSCGPETERYHDCNQTWVWDGKSYETTNKYEVSSYWFDKPELVERIKSRAVDGQTEAWEASFTDERLKGPRKTNEELIEMGYGWRWDEGAIDITPIPGALMLKGDCNSDLSISEEDSNSDLSTSVFPYVSWNRANRSKAWYKDVDWSGIPFNDLSDIEIENIDWSKLNYKEAGQSDSFDIAFIDWSEANSASKTQKKIYKDLNWQGVDYQSLSNGTKEGIDWSRVDYKEAIRSETFNLDAVDIIELKNNPKAFKKFLKSTALKKASADSLLKQASSATIEEIGLKNYAGKISDKLTKSFSTESAEYKLVMKPSSHHRASAIAKGMGGKLVELESVEESNLFSDALTGLIADRSLVKKLSKTTASDGGGGSYLWLGGSDESSEGEWKWLSSDQLISTTRSDWATKVSDETTEPDNMADENELNITQDYLAQGLWDLNILKPGGQWVDLLETNKLWFVVEMPDI